MSGDMKLNAVYAAATTTTAADTSIAITAAGGGGAPSGGSGSGLELVPVSFTMPPLNDTTATAIATAAASHSQTIIRSVPEPANRGSCKLVATRSWEGGSLLVAALALIYIFYYGVQGTDPVNLLVGIGFFLFSLTSAYGMHQIAGNLEFEEQISMLRNQITALSGEVNRLKPENDRYAALNGQFNSLLQRLGKVATDFQGINTSLQLTGNELHQAEEEIERVAKVFETLQGKLKIYLNDFAPALEKLKIENANLSASVTAIVKAANAEKGVADVMKANQATLTEITAKQNDLVRREAELLKRQEALVVREQRVAAQLEKLAKRGEIVIQAAEQVLTPGGTHPATAVAAAAIAASSSATASTNAGSSTSTVSSHEIYITVGGDTGPNEVPDVPSISTAALTAPATATTPAK